MIWLVGHLYDKSGNEFTANRINEKRKITKGFMPNVPVNVKFKFKNVDITKPNSLTIIVSCFDKKTDKVFRIILKNINLPDKIGLSRK